MESLRAFMTQVFYGNSLQDWAIAFVILAGTLVVAKLVYWVLSRFLKRLFKRAESRLMELVVDMIEEPVVFSMIISGFWFGLNTLQLPAAVGDWFGRVFQVLIVLAIGWLVARLLDALLSEFVKPLTAKTETDLDDQLMPILRKSMKIIVLGLTVVIALNNVGYDVAALLAGLGIGGLAMAMAAKDTVSNVFGGVTIFTDQPFTINDRIRASGFDGTVEEIGVRSTRIRTLDGTLVTIPNSSFAESAVENVSAEPSRKVKVNLGLTYDTTPEQMQEAMTILADIADGNDGLLENRTISFNAFGDSAMNIIFIYYIKKGAAIMDVQTEINMEILSRFNARGLEFAFPTQTIYTRAETAT
jgi:MscS family membrane protein